MATISLDHSRPGDVLQRLWQNIRRLTGGHYATGILLTAAMMTVVFLLIGTGLENQRGNIARVKLAENVVRLAEAARAEILALSQTSDPDINRRARSRLLEILTKIGDSQSVLASGERILPTQDLWYVTAPGELSDELRRIYHGDTALDSRIGEFITLARSIASRSRVRFDNPVVDRTLAMIDNLIPDLERAARLVEKESAAQFDQAVTTFSTLYILMLLGLLGIAQIVVKPLIVKLEQTIGQLQQERDFTSTVLNTAQALIAVTDSEGKIRLINEYTQQESGWAAEELEGENFFDHFIPENENAGFRDNLRQLLAGELLESELETPFLLRTGESLTVVWHNTVLPAQGDQPLLLMTGINITERKQAENRLRHTLDELERLHQRQNEEIRMAASLQQAMLPPPKIALPGIEGYAAMRTSSAVGGDYYDYYAVDDRYSVILVGDVTGHGVGAGSLVSAVKAAVTRLRSHHVHRPAEILASVNDIVADVGQQTLFMTMACLVLDAREGKLQLACAGHAPPYYLPENGDPRPLESFAQPLGQDQSHDYREAEIEAEWALGARIVLFTDGLVEEESPSGEMYGYERLEQEISRSREAPEQLCQKVFETLQQHTLRSQFEDDVTIVTLDHTERVVGQETLGTDHIHFIPLSHYRRGEHPEPEIDRRWLVLQTDGPFKEFLPDIARDDIRRVVPVAPHPLYDSVSMETLLAQHDDHGDDLTQLLGPSHWRQSYPLTHTDDKGFILEELEALLRDRGCTEEQTQQMIIVADEMLENAFYAAPRDGRHRPLHEKGTPRSLDEETVLIEIAQLGDLWALMATDTWGTLTSERFLAHLSRASREGVTSGVGGAGLYMMWELSHYFQVRVHPHQHTRVLALWNTGDWTPVSEDTGFQYFEQ